MLHRTRALLILPVLAFTGLFAACGTGSEEIPESAEDSGISSHTDSTVAADDARPLDGSVTIGDDGGVPLDGSTTTDGSAFDGGPLLAFCDPANGHLFCADFEDLDANKGFGTTGNYGGTGTVTRDTSVSSEQTASARFALGSGVDSGIEGSYLTLTSKPTAALMAIGKRELAFDVYVPTAFSFAKNTDYMVIAELYFLNGGTSASFSVVYRNDKIILSRLKNSQFEASSVVDGALPKGTWVTFTLSADGATSPMPYRLAYRAAGGSEVLVGEGTEPKLAAISNVGSPQVFLRIGPQTYFSGPPAITLNFDRVALDQK